MDADRYQRAALTTWRPEPATTPHGRIIDLLYNGGQLSSEAGEINGIIAKWAKYGAPLDVADLRAELGDLLWHLATLASLAGLTLSEIMEANLAKLRARHGDHAPDLWYQRQREAAQAAGLVDAATLTLSETVTGILATGVISGDTWTEYDTSAPAPQTGRGTDGA